MSPSKRDKADAPLRSDAQRNRERILRVATEELTRCANVPLSAIAKKAGVGQGTFYRNFPHREALVLEVYRYGCGRWPTPRPRCWPPWTPSGPCASGWTTWPGSP
ncbi:hypothetical protein STENM327S_08980 [Streptomyces tendae]